jgi:hypothetical protein
MDQVVPVERRQQERRRHARSAEVLIGLTLDVEVRHLVPAEQRRHARVVELDPAARVLKRRPDHVLHSGDSRGIGERVRLGTLAVRRHVVPEERHAIGAVRTGEGPRDGSWVGEVGRYDFSAGGRQLPGLVRARVARDGAHRELTLRIGQDRTH